MARARRSTAAGPFTVEDCFELVTRGRRKGHRSVPISGHQTAWIPSREPYSFWLPRHGWQTLQLGLLSVFDDHYEREVEFTWGAYFVRQTITLVTTPQPLGGERWWMVCGRPRADGTLCPVRAAKLYLPPDRHWFACRECHHLGYLSSWNSHQYDFLYREQSKTLGLSPQLTKDLLTHGQRRGPQRSRPPVLPADWNPPGIDLQDYPGWASLRDKGTGRQAPSSGPPATEPDRSRRRRSRRRRPADDA